MNDGRGLEQVDGVLLGVVVLLVLASVALLVLLLGEGSSVGVEPHVIGFALAITVVLGWFTLERR